MDSLQKLQLLSDASQYDLACACGSNNQDRRKRGNDGSWLYPVTLASGGTAIMLKTLLSNVCVNDCGYCPCRNNTDIRRCTIEPTELAILFLEYVRKNKVFGLFLSSGVIKDPDHTMQLLNDTATLLRKKYEYRGYIHLKIIPGSSDAAIESALNLANAVSINIETPGANRFAHLSSKKEYMRDIIGPLQFISKLTAKGMKHARVKKTTQFIVGASDETDAEIVKYTAGLYDKLSLNRVYFSAYQRGLGDKRIPGELNELKEEKSGFVREHRLYQADFLLRKYSFTLNDIYYDATGNLIEDKDPKLVWAERHREFFPVNVNRASKFELLRVPGFGPQRVKRILEMRKYGSIKLDSILTSRKLKECTSAYLTA